MGRRNRIADPAAAIRFHLYALQWVDGDYDEGGAYWGNSGGTRIYRAIDQGPDFRNEMFVRAKDREAAKSQVMATFPAATFFR